MVYLQITDKDTRITKLGQVHYGPFSINSFVKTELVQVLWLWSQMPFSREKLIQAGNSGEKKNLPHCIQIQRYNFKVMTFIFFT